VHGPSSSRPKRSCGGEPAKTFQSHSSSLGRPGLEIDLQVLRLCNNCVNELLSKVRIGFHQSAKVVLGVHPFRNVFADVAFARYVSDRGPPYLSNSPMLLVLLRECLDVAILTRNTSQASATSPHFGTVLRAAITTPKRLPQRLCNIR
jgi:hypothetical protein